MMEKLTCKDLVVGDYVMFNGEVLKVEEISKKGWIHLEDIDTDTRVEMTSDYIIKNLEPISITPEILEKNGFEHQHNIGYIYEDGYGGKVVYETFDNTLKIFYNYDMLVNITFFDRIAVHELQRALKLCRIEKEIVL